MVLIHLSVTFFLNSCQGGQLRCLPLGNVSTNAAGHSVSFVDVIINRDSVTQIEASLHLHPSRHAFAGIAFLHLILCLPAVIDFCLKERYCQGWDGQVLHANSSVCKNKTDSTQTPRSVSAEGEGDLISYTHIQHMMYLAAGARSTEHPQIPACIQSPSKEEGNSLAKCRYH